MGTDEVPYELRMGKNLVQVGNKSNKIKLKSDLHCVMKLSPQGKQLVEYALIARAWTLETLAKEGDLGISTVKKFSARQNVSRKTFVNLCNVLDVDWESALEQENAPSDTLSSASSTSSALAQETISSTCSSTSSHFDQSISSENSRNFTSGSPAIDQTLIQEIQERCRQKIRKYHSRMQLLMSRAEIEINQLYVDVWLLEQPESEYVNSPNGLLKSFDIEKNRLALGKRIKHYNGFEIANKKDKLVILGKPGSGKTTFLKYLAVDWCNGKFKSQLIAIFIELRQIRYNKIRDFLIVIQEELLGQEFSEIEINISKTEENISQSEEGILRYKKRIKNLDKNKQAEKENKVFIEREIRESNKESKRIEKDIEILEQKRNQQKNLEKEINALEQGCSISERKINIEELEQKYINLEQNSNAVKRRYRILKQEVKIKDLEQNHRIEEPKNNELKRKYNITKQEKNSLEQRYRILGQEKNDLEQRYKILGQEIKIKGLEQEYSILEQTRNDFNQEYSILEQARNDFNQEYSILEQARNDFNQEYSILEQEIRYLAEFKSLEQKLKDSPEFKNLDLKIKDITRKLKNIREFLQGQQG
ncbi:MAG: NACHT domain-containing protein, partial [Cyanobacteria bacterium P01_E01_bin.42]